MLTVNQSDAIFYRSLANSIGKAEGTILLYLNPGRWHVNLSGQDIILVISPNTRATVEFHYINGMLEDATITFNKPIQIVFPGNAGNVSVKGIYYDEFGDVTSVDMDINTPLSPVSEANLGRALSIQRKPNDLFWETLLAN